MFSAALFIYCSIPYWLMYIFPCTSSVVDAAPAFICVIQLAVPPPAEYPIVKLLYTPKFVFGKIIFDAL